jgi:hypothetical protein
MNLTPEQPKDEEIVACLLGGYPSLPTYVVKNKLREKYRAVKTPFVLRRLKALEKAGHVLRVPGYSTVHHSWTIAPPKDQSC